MSTPTTPRRAALAAGLALLLLAVLVPALPAAAASWSCDASAARTAFATAPPAEPVTANRGAASCTAASAGGAAALAGLPAPLTGATLGAATDVRPAAATPDQQAATATATVSNLRVLPLPGQIPAPAIPPGLASFAIPGGPAVDLTPAIQALVTPAGRVALGRRAHEPRHRRVPRRAPDARRRVVRGRPAGPRPGRRERRDGPAGRERHGGPDDRPGGARPLEGHAAGRRSAPPALVAPLQAALAAVPPIAIPAQAGRVTVRRGEEVAGAGRLTRRALHVTLELDGQTVLDAVLGEASVGQDGVTCGGAAQVAAEQALQCTKRRLVLVDVHRRAGRVRLLVVADRRLIGRTVAIRFVRLSTRSRGRVVAHARVGRNGVFRGTAPLPARKLRRPNRARYQAVLGHERPLRLKLVRRMTVTSVRSARGRVTISGRVLGPLASPARAIVVRRRVSCSRTVVARRVRPDRAGRFRVTLAGPPRTLAATYRFETQVRRHASNPKLFPTFTLPRSVEFR